jgi:hypothetical protein
MKSKQTKKFISYLLEQIEQESEKPKLVFLIGPPAVGKTEYIKRNLIGYEIVNRDDIVEEVARESGVGTYDDMYARPPAELAAQSGPPPEKEIIQLYGKDEEATKIVDNYLKKIEMIAKIVPPSEKYGNIKPFDLESLQQVIVKFGVPTKFINPFVWEKVDEANKTVGEKLADTRNKAVVSNKDIAIDMVNMGVGERNSHRKDILKALNVDSNNLSSLNNYYEQIAIVFAPEGGYTPEIIEKIKKVAVLRQGEIAAMGGAKTIPPQAYDRMFANFQPPTEAEGFSKIEYVGVPSLAKLDNSLMESKPFNLARLQRLAGIIKD